MDTLPEETKTYEEEVKEIFRERCDNYSARFFGLIAPSIVAPLAIGIADGVGRSIVDDPARLGVYATVVALHQLRNRPDLHPRLCTGSLSDIIVSLSLTDGILLTGASYGIGRGIGEIIGLFS